MGHEMSEDEGDDEPAEEERLPEDPDLGVAGGEVVDRDDEVVEPDLDLEVLEPDLEIHWLFRLEKEQRELLMPKLIAEGTAARKALDDAQHSAMSANEAEIADGCISLIEIKHTEAPDDSK